MRVAMLPYLVLWVVLTHVVFVCAGCDTLDSEQGVIADEPKTYDETVFVDSVERSFLVHVPGQLSQPAALVLAFHGRFGYGQDQLRLSGMNEIADANGFIVLYPDGENREWDAGIRQGGGDALPGDDMAFVDAMIEKMENEFQIDPKRIYATGMSNGASFVHRMACEMSDKIAAVAAVASTIAPAIDSSCQPARMISVMQISGTEDPIVPYEGNLILLSVDETVDGWASRNGCERAPEESTLEGGIVEESYGACLGGTEIVLLSVEGGGHTWPGGWQYAPVSVVGETSDAINASEEIWRFFSEHPMP